MSLRYLDKISDELMFFYNPNSFEKILNGSVFPSLGILSDSYNIVSSISKEVFGDSDKAHPTKYILKALPITKEFTNFIPFISEDLAKDMGIRVTSQSRR